MAKMEIEIENLRSKLHDYCFENDDVNYVIFRLRAIRKELSKTNKIFETQHICKVIGISENTFIKLESGTVASDYRSVIKLIHLYSMFGYNPLWMLKKDNIFIEQKGSDNDFTLNKSSVQSAVNNFVNDVELADGIREKALDNLKKEIKKLTY